MAPGTAKGAKQPGHGEKLFAYIVKPIQPACTRSMEARKDMDEYVSNSELGLSMCPCPCPCKVWYSSPGACTSVKLMPGQQHCRADGQTTGMLRVELHMLASCRNECATGVKAGHVTVREKTGLILSKHSETATMIQATAERQSDERMDAMMLRKLRVGHKGCGGALEEAGLETSDHPDAKFSWTAAPRIQGEVTMACSSKPVRVMTGGDG